MSWYLKSASVGFASLGALIVGSPAFAAPIYVGLSLNGGATINSELTSTSGTDSLSSVIDGNFDVNVTAVGTPPGPEPSLLSNTISTSSTGAGTLTILVTGTNEFPLVPGFLSSFTSNLLPAGWTVTESTYVNNCAVPASACGIFPSGDVFNTTNLLSKTAFTSAGAVTTGAADPIVLTSDYAITEEFTITATGAGSTNDTIDLTATPLPGALSLFAGGLGFMGFFAQRRKRRGVTTAIA
jgi:hypothetical protein